MECFQVKLENEINRGDLLQNAEENPMNLGNLAGKY